MWPRVSFKDPLPLRVRVCVFNEKRPLHICAPPGLSLSRFTPNLDVMHPLESSAAVIGFTSLIAVRLRLIFRGGKHLAPGFTGRIKHTLLPLFSE